MNSNTGIWRSVFFPYVSYVSLFLGMGLISGSIVHMPIDPARYTTIALVGVVLFGFASFVQDMSTQEITTAGVIRSLLFSLLLSVGIGMMSGGVQHFSDNMAYSAILIPTGFGVSLFAWLFKNRVQLSIKKAYLVVLIFLAVALPLKVSLDYVVEANGGAASSGHGHGGDDGHGEEAPATETKPKSGGHGH